MKREVQKLLEKADHALEVAESLYKNEFSEDAASKLYYAMFYAAQALLKSEDIQVMKHSAVESAFGYHFVKTAMIDPKYHRMLMNARKLRELVDYGIQGETVEPGAAVRLEDGKQFVAVIRAMLAGK